MLQPGSKAKGGTVSLGKARKVGLVDKLLSGVDFIIVLNWSAWQKLDDAKRRALLDHELTHCEMAFDDDGQPVTSIRKHDVEDFTAIVERHGSWTGGMEELESTLKKRQQTLFDAEEKKAGAKAPTARRRKAG